MTFPSLALYLSCPKFIIPVERFYVTKIRSFILIESMTSFSFHEECQLERNHQGYWNLLRIVWCPLTITYVHLLKVIQNTAFFEIQHVTYTLTHARRKKSQRLEMSRHHKSCYMLQCQRHRQRRMKKNALSSILCNVVSTEDNYCASYNNPTKYLSNISISRDYTV